MVVIAAWEDVDVASLAAYVRRPRLDYKPHATALDHNELGAFLVAPGKRPSANCWTSRLSKSR